MRFLADCIFGLLFAAAVGSIAAPAISAVLQHDAALIQGAVKP